MKDWINQLNYKHYNVKRIHRIMKVLNIHSVIRRKRKKYLRSDPEAVAENILARDFYAEAPNLKWAADVTKFKRYEGSKVHKLYLSAILDLYDRSIVAWVVSKRNNKLVFDTFEQAILANPDAKPLFHSDRGFKYTSRAFQMKLKAMPRVGHCVDNGPTEGFWSILKTEMYYLNHFTGETSLHRAITQYIDFYNNVRVQERFGNRTPAQVRREALGANIPAQYPLLQTSALKNTSPSMLPKKQLPPLRAAVVYKYFYLLSWSTWQGAVHRSLRVLFLFSPGYRGEKEDFFKIRGFETENT